MPDAPQIETYARLLRLTPVVEASSKPKAEFFGLKPSATPRKKRKILTSFILLVAVPTALAALYFCLIAADRYESETRFILRVPGRPLMGAAAPELLQSIGVSRANDDGYVVREYLESRDAMSLLAQKAELRERFSKAKWDIFWKYPSVFTVGGNEERLYDFYQRMMTASFDNATGVSTLKVQAFAAADAQALAAALLSAAEEKVNRINDRARHDAMDLADTEVSRMRQRTLAAQAALTSFREREQMVDPGQSGLAVLETIARLSMEAAHLSVQLNELAAASPQAPQSAPLRNRRAAIESQIARERQRLAGDVQSIAPRIAEYERLMLEREFAERSLVAAMTAVEVARIESQKQQIYLERVSEPSSPDYPTYPLRIVWFLVAFVVCYMTYRIWRTISADTMQHADP